MQRQLAGAHALAAACLLAACGPGNAPPDFTIQGTGVVVRSDASFARRPDLPARLESTVGAALQYWGGGWEDLKGRTITLDGARYVECGGLTAATACYDGDIRVSTGDLGTPFDCVEQTALVHEVGHAVLGDPGHEDPRWMDFGPVALALAGRIGYQGQAVVACPIHVSVWQHPPSTG